MRTEAYLRIPPLVGRTSLTEVAQKLRPTSGLLACLCLLSIARVAAQDHLPLAPPSGRTPLGQEAAILRLEDRREFGRDLYLLLSSEDPALRERAAVAAGRIGDPRAIDPLAALLHDREARVRSGAAFALGEIEDSSSAIPLSLLLRPGAEEAPHVRALAVEGLGKLQAVRFAPLCVDALSDTSAEVRQAAALASWQLRAASGWKLLVRMAGDPDPATRWKSTYALMRMLGAAASGRTPIPGGATLPDEARGPIRTVLIERLQDAEVLCRLAAARGLAVFGDPDAGRFLTAALSDADWRVRVEAIRALATRPRDAGQMSPRAIDRSTWSAVLRDPNPDVRIAALEAMGTDTVSSGTIAELQAVLARPDLSGREREVASLSIASRWKTEIGKASADRAESLRAAISGLAASLASAATWNLRATAADVIADTDPIDRALLRRLLHDEPRVAKTAVEPLFLAVVSGIGGGGDRLAALRPDLEPLLSSPDPILRAITIEAAGSALGDSLAGAARADWIALLAHQWDDSGPERDSDLAGAVLGGLGPYASDPAAQRVLRDGASCLDPLARREARRILVAAGIEKEETAPAPVETGRETEDYASILRWAQEEHEVAIRTARGVIRIRLFSREAPLTCWNFVRLAGAGFYDRGRWHRIVPDFVVQDGCPRGDGYGGPGYAIRCEINEERFVTGAVGMALSGKDTGGSQFFICHSPQPHLDGRYTVFGQVTEGMDAVDRTIQHDEIDSIRSIR